jgi:F0F1-type ATP synthase assembly protein I
MFDLSTLVTPLNFVIFVIMLFCLGVLILAKASYPNKKNEE